MAIFNISHALLPFRYFTIFMGTRNCSLPPKGKVMHKKKSYAQVKAIEKKNRERLLKVNPKLNNLSGIYFLTRTDEDGISYFYIGQSVSITSRLCSHLVGFQHIDNSLKSRGLYDEEKNPYGWKVNFINYPKDKLDEMEQYWILEYTKKGYQCRYNKTAGGQGTGKEKINEYRPAKGYRDGLKQGEINASRNIAHLFDKHLNVSTKDDPPGRYQKQALEKFNDFLNLHREGNKE